MKLDKETLIDAASKSLENAKELINEGTLLFDNGHYARAFTLFQLSIEEVGKSSLIFESILFQKYETKKQQKTLLKEIRNHKNKTKVAQRIDSVLALFIPDIELKKVLLNNAIKQSKAIDKINDYKNYSLYVSLIKNKFIKPSEIIGKDLTKDYKFYAEIRCEATRQLQEMLLKDLEGVMKKFKTIDSEDFIKNPPEGIKELIALVE